MRITPAEAAGTVCYAHGIRVYEPWEVSDGAPEGGARIVEFPVSGVEANPLLVLLAAFVVSALCAPAGVSGAFLLLPFQVSVWALPDPR